MISLTPNITKKYTEFLKLAGNEFLQLTPPFKFDKAGGLKFAGALKNDVFVLNPTKNLIPAEKSKTIEEIQNGISGKIRSAEELSSKDIMKLIDYQLSAIKAKDIEQVLAKFSKEDKALALKAMKRLTQFGNMESLNPLVETSKKLSVISVDNQYGIWLLNDKKASLSNHISYLNSKNVFESGKEIEFDDVLGNYILDEAALEHLEKDKGFRNQIKELGSKLIYPEGWINGINPYNQTENLFESVSKVVFDTKKLQKSGMSEQKALHEAINMPIKERLIDIGLIANLKIIKNELTKNMPGTVETIESQLKPISISLEKLEENLSFFTPIERQAALEALAHGMIVESPKGFGQMLKCMHTDILKQNNGNLDGMYYLIPKSGKSYGTVMMQYKLLNKIPDSKILYNNKDFVSFSKFVLPEDCKKIVILDDMSISGESYRGVIGALKDKFNELKIIAAPTYIHKGIKNHLENVNAFDEDDAKNICISAKEIDSVINSEYFNSLDDKSKQLLTKFAVVGGFGKGQKTSLALPWMAPDNNTDFFSNVIAPFFTLNGKGSKSNPNGFKAFTYAKHMPEGFSIYINGFFKDGKVIYESS